MRRWWWESYTVEGPGPRGKRPAVPCLGLVEEAPDRPEANAGVRPPDNPGEACTIGVGNTGRWLQHVELGARAARFW